MHICEGKPRKNLTQETCPDRGSNPGPLHDKHACCCLAHSSGQHYTMALSFPYTLLSILIITQIALLIHSRRCSSFLVRESGHTMYKITFKFKSFTWKLWKTKQLLQVGSAGGIVVSKVLIPQPCFQSKQHPSVLPLKKKSKPGAYDNFSLVNHTS